MRFVGLLLVLFGAAVAFYIGYLGWSIDQVRTHLAQLLNLPGLAPAAAASSSSTSQGWNQWNGNPAGQSVAFGANQQAIDSIRQHFDNIWNTFAGQQAQHRPDQL